MQHQMSVIIITFTIDVTNNGPDVANNVEITDQLPSSGLALVFDKYTATQGSYDEWHRYLEHRRHCWC